jgi:5-methylphenazine-1-carboxylate 1-monooxygenase
MVDIKKDLRILIAGGGIGGLTTALYLHRAGIPVKVFESVHNIRPLGVGINIQPHAVKRLFALGLQDGLDATGIRTARLSFYSKRGSLIWTEPRGLDAGYDVPQYSIHRGDLQMLLLDAVIERIGQENVLTGHHLAGFEQDDDGVMAHFIDRKTDKAVGSYRGDVLVGADGIMSQTRHTFYPDEGVPVYSGLILWRGIVETAPYLDGRSMIMVGNSQRKAVIYPVSQKSKNVGRSLVNWIAELPIPMDLPPQKEDWNRPGNKADFEDYFKSWDFPWLNIPKLIDITESIYEFPMIDRDPIPQWSFGRVTMLGDAAHAMRPNGSNGASQAIWDAEVLCEMLVKHTDVAQALKAYEDSRLEPVSKVVLENRKAGPEVVMQEADDNCTGQCINQCTCLPSEYLEKVASRYKKLAGFDQATVHDQSN